MIHLEQCDKPTKPFLGIETEIIDIPPKGGTCDKPTKPFLGIETSSARTLCSSQTATNQLNPS